MMILKIEIIILLILMDFSLDLTSLKDTITNLWITKFINRL